MMLLYWTLESVVNSENESPALGKTSVFRKTE